MSEGKDTSERVIDWRTATPEEQAAFWRRVEQHAAQYASVTVILPPRFVGEGPPLVVFDDGEGKGDE